MSELKQITTDLSDKIKKAIKINLKDGRADDELLKDVYVSTLPEGLTKEIIEQVDQHNTVFGPAALKALGDVSTPLMKKHPNLVKTELKIPTVDKSFFSAVFEHTAMVRAPGKEPAPKHGVGTVKLDWYGASSHRGEYKKVKDQLADNAASVLAD